jgi:hypothetical protein
VATGGFNGAGTLTVTAGGSITLGGDAGVANIGLIIGSNHNGTMTIEQGATVTSGRQVGVASATTTRVPGTEHHHRGTLNVSDGNFSIANRTSTLPADAADGNKGNVSMSGSTSAITVAGAGADFNIGIASQAGTYTQTGGTLSVNDVIEVGTSAGTSTGSSFTLSGGTASSGTSNGATAGTFFVGRGSSVNSKLTVERRNAERRQSPAAWRRYSHGEPGRALRRHHQRGL